MSSRTLDLRKVFGTIVTYNYIRESLVAPNQPFTDMVELYPGGESPVHFHPGQDETYEVQEGELEILIDGEWKRVPAGEKICIPKGTRHAFRNTAREKVVAAHILSPGLRFGEMLETIQQHISEKKITGTKGFKNRAYIASIMLNYPDVVVPVSPTPARLKMMVRAGRLFGFK